MASLSKDRRPPTTQWHKWTLARNTTTTTTTTILWGFLGFFVYITGCYRGILGAPAVVERLTGIAFVLLRHQD
jgi:hypothetical protein